MKKKFDFSAEMNDTESIKSTPKNEYLEEEKQLLDVNAKELANLNDNVHEMSINLVNLLKFLREYKLTIAQKYAGASRKIPGNLYLISSFAKFKTNGDETERKNPPGRQLRSHTALGILYSDYHSSCPLFFFASIIVANAEILHSAVIWKAVVCCTFMAVLGIICTVVIPKLLDKLK